MSERQIETPRLPHGICRFNRDIGSRIFPFILRQRLGEPTRGKRRNGGDPDRAAGVAASVDRPFKVGHGSADLGAQRLRRGRCRDAGARAKEQWPAKLGLEVTDAQAHGGRSDSELGCSARHILVAHAGFEHAQGFERGKSHGHTQC